MRTRAQQKKVNVVTLGCSKNIVDSEVLMGQLRANGVEVAHQTHAPEYRVVVVNTCGFIENAKEESIETILTFSEARRKGDIEKLYVTGCLSERYKDELAKEIDHVDGWFGTGDLPRLLKTMGADYKHELVGERLLSTPAHYAYMKVSEGCNKKCAFCAIPLMRGKHRSKSIEQLVDEARKLAAGGTRELILIAQDMSYYGKDLYGKRKLPQLLEALAAVEGIAWIRIHYVYPSQFPLDTLEVMRAHPNICNYLDMPLQHISDRMLKSMRRGITQKRTYELIDKVRETVPGIALRTTLMTGFPGETEADFAALVDFVEEVRFDRLGVFTYSHEENTTAHALEDDVPEAVKQERAAILMDRQQDISVALNQKRVGQTFPVLFDRREGDYFIGRTEYDSVEVDNEVRVPVDKHYVRIGDFATVRITGADVFDLYGEVVKTAHPHHPPEKQAAS